MTTRSHGSYALVLVGLAAAAVTWTVFGAISSWLGAEAWATTSWQVSAATALLLIVASAAACLQASEPYVVCVNCGTAVPERDTELGFDHRLRCVQCPPTTSWAA